jgi:hypothetical protein
MENLPGRTSLVRRRTCVPFDHRRAAHYSPRQQALREPPDASPFLILKRFHLPMLLVEARLIPRKTPIPLDPRLICEKDPMFDQLRGVRARTLVFMEETLGKDLKKYHMPHPFLGTLNVYEWFQMIVSRQIRHTKQLKEIAAALPKTVATLH